jgi:hypothetical protein
LINLKNQKHGTITSLNPFLLYRLCPDEIKNHFSNNLKNYYMNVFKKTVLAITLLLIGSNTCFAQKISIRGGFNLSQINFKVGDFVIQPMNSDSMILQMMKQ